MAFIKLLYIDGISRENTPYFANLSAQELFMGSKVIKTLTDGFYVPHYTDVLTIDMTDVGFVTKVNYVWISFGSRSYYYFIDNVEYVSESDIQIGITLDSIQTFMFDMIVHDSIIERKFIDRYSSGSINRNYIRENLSEGIFKVIKRKVYNDNKKDWVIIGQFASDVDGNQTFGPVSTPFGSAQSPIYNYYKPYLYFFDPFEGGYYQSQTIPATNIINHGALKAMCTDIYLIPFNAIKDYSIATNHIVTGVSGTVKLGPGDNDYSLYNSQYFSRINDNIVPLSDYIIQSSALWTPWDPSFMTQMLDENYMNISFGDAQERTTYPLFMTSKTTMLKSYYWADVSTGVRYYNLSEDSYADNVYMTIVSNNSVLHMDIKNDPWQEYISRNRSTMGSALVSDIGSAVSSFGSMNLSADKGVTAMENILLDKKSYDKRFKSKKVLKRAPARALQKVNFENDVSNLRKFSLENSVSSELNKRYNLKHAPSSVKMSGDASQDFVGNGTEIFLTIEFVQDFYQVAYYFHQYGFLVNIPYRNNVSNTSGHYLFTDLMSRYYFDYYKFNYIDLDLDIMCSADMIDDLTDRLTSGVRVWYLDHGTMCDYQYDNVERSVLS